MWRGRIWTITTAWLAAAIAPLTLPSAAQTEQLRESQFIDVESQEWRDLPPAADGATPVGELDAARKALADGRPADALKTLRKWVPENTAHERYLEGVYLLAESYFETKDFYKAYENYEVVVENSGGDLYRRALLREMDVARAFLSGEKRIVWRVLRLPAYDDGVQILDRVWERVPGTRLGEEALRMKADYFFAAGEMDTAQAEYAMLAQQYPAGRYAQQAALRSAEAADASFGGTPFDDKPLIEARERYERLEKEYPEFARVEDVEARLAGIRTQRAEKDLYVARWYERARRPDAAAYYYRVILRDWPGTLAAAEAQRRLRALGFEPPAEEAAP
jgi:TolA-binding protein